jgi:hypothetical protein
MQQQTDDRGEARHATEKSVPEQQANKTCAEEAGSNPGEQSAAEHARTHCSLADGRGVAGLYHRILDRRGGRCGGRGGWHRTTCRGSGVAAVRANSMDRFFHLLSVVSDPFWTRSSLEALTSLALPAGLEPVFAP